MSNPESPDMSSEAIDRRLRKQSELLDFCQRLRKESGLPTRPPEENQLPEK